MGFTGEHNGFLSVLGKATMEEEEFETKRKRRYHLIIFKMKNNEVILVICSYPFFKQRWRSSEVANTFDFENLLVRAAESHGLDPKDPSDDKLFEKLLLLKCS
ncbi:hypothetical protein ISCGN_022376 [Ixodes scapularis]